MFKHSRSDDPVSISIPQAMHTVFKYEQGQSIRVPRYTTHTVPDVTVNTQVVAVVGIRPEEAAPQADGWFRSDFFAFWNVLQGMTSTQTSTLTIWSKSMVDAEILAKPGQSQHCPEQIKDVLLMRGFQSAIRSECVAAKEAGNQSVLVLIFGHGDPDKYGIYLGSGSNTITMSMLEKAGQDLDVNIYGP